MYFSNTFPAEYGILPKEDLVNHPELLLASEEKQGLDSEEYTKKVAGIIVDRLGLAKK